MNVVITGATKGIGKAIAKKFVQEGYNICICSRNEADLNALKSSLAQINSEVSISVFKCDVSNKQELNAFGKFALETLDNRIDVLINNAGLFLAGAIIDEADGQLEKMIETNVYSAYHLSRQLIPSMISRASGHIINICSIASQIAYPNGGSYSISKFALLGLSKVLRAELNDKGIRVTSVLPGATWSNSWEGVDLPEERLMQAEDIAKVVYTSVDLADSAVMEEVIIRPLLGDL